MSETRQGAALIGAAVAESPSPAMHNAGLAAAGLSGVYRAVSLGDDASVDRWRALEKTHCGLNVTAPYKRFAYDRYEACVDEVAARVGAINTVRFEGPPGEAPKRVAATNTDVIGLREAWRRAAIDVEGERAVVIGAGGAARAAVVALAAEGVREVFVWARRTEAAQDLLALALQLGVDGARLALADAEAPPPSPRLVVMAASALDDEAAQLPTWTDRACAVHDLRYGRQTHPLRNAALSQGHLYLDGTSMLLAQGVAAFSFLFGVAADEQTRAALTRGLREGLASHRER